MGRINEAPENHCKETVSTGLSRVEDPQMRRRSRLACLSLLSALAAVSAFILCLFFAGARVHRLVLAFFFLSLLLSHAAFILSLFSLLTLTIHHKCLKGWSYAIAAFFLSFPGIWANHSIRSFFEYIYTPPALNSQNISVYSKFVTLVASHPEYKRVRLDRFGDSHLEKYDRATKFAYPSRSVDYQLHEIASAMRQIDCILAEKNGNFVAFVPGKKHFLPRPPGVLYSLDDSSPNEVDDEFLNDKKPFVLIKDRWYMSRHIGSFNYSRYDKKPLPSCALMDHSLRDPGE